jgi:hypothetical protein
MRIALPNSGTESNSRMSAFSKTALYAGRTDLPPLVAEAAARDQFGRSVTVVRKHWLEHPDLFAAEIRLTGKMSAIVATLKARRP